MKKLVCSFIIASLATASLFAQKNFEGIITYQITYENLPPEMQQQAALLPKDMTLSLSGEKSRVDQKTMMGNQSVITDRKSGEVIIFTEAMGQKILMRDLINTKEESKDIKINYMDNDTKEIAGYLCKKADIIDEKNKSIIHVYYTEKIGAENPDEKFKKLKGFPLEYNMNQNGITMKIVATKVEEKKLDASLFEEPEGYTEMKKEDLMRMGQ